MTINKIIREEDIIVACRAAAVELAEDTRTLHQLRDLSYSEQYDILFTGQLDAKKVILPRPTCPSAWSTLCNPLRYPTHVLRFTTYPQIAHFFVKLIF